MYVDEINAKGGVNGQKLSLVIYDDGADANSARTFATRLIEEDKIAAMIGGSHRLDHGDDAAVRKGRHPADLAERQRVVDCRDSSKPAVWLAPSAACPAGHRLYAGADRS
jgi:substrate-binding family protein